MNTFKEVKANKRSLWLRRLVYDVGVNDSDYLTECTIDGKRIKCPYYRKWVAMLERGYSPKYHAKFPTYKDCTVAPEWLTFSIFKEWMIQQDWQGNVLDKDLLVQGNKLYSPETCIFVSSQINGLLIDSGASRGKYPIGVSCKKATGKYVAQCNVAGKTKNIGQFDTPAEAHERYKAFKYGMITGIALCQEEPLQSALMNYKIEG